MADRIEHGTTPRGRKQRLVKLTEEQVRQIRALAKQMARPLSGKITPNPYDIARQFGVSPPTIYGIINRKTWAWLD